MSDFSVIISIYRNDCPDYVARAVESITTYQTRHPSEIVMIVDGPIPLELDNLVKNYELNPMFKVIRLSANKGLGNALRIGVEKAGYDLVARMDSDDVSAPDRFEKQIAYMVAHPDCDVVGGQMSEFIDSEDNIVGNRPVPYEDKDIKQFLKSRCPLNHVTVMMRKNAVLGVGNYIDWHYNEDYYLWIRMTLSGCCFANLPDTLVNVRVGKEMYQRRGGRKYFKSEKDLQDYMHRHKMISFPRYCYNTMIRYIVQVAMPNKLRGLIFQKFARK